MKITMWQCNNCGKQEKSNTIPIHWIESEVGSIYVHSIHNKKDKIFNVEYDSCWCSIECFINDIADQYNEIVGVQPDNTKLTRLKCTMCQI